MLLRGIDVMVIVLYVRLLLKGVSTNPQVSPEQAQTNPEQTQSRYPLKATGRGPCASLPCGLLLGFMKFEPLQGPILEPILRQKTISS